MQLISREELLRRPSCIAIKLSPDARQLAYIGSDSEGALNIYVTSGLQLTDARQVTHFETHTIQGFHWTADGKRLLVIKDTHGDGVSHLYSVDLTSFQVKDLTAAYPQANAKIFRVSDSAPEAVIGLNARDPHFYDVYLIDFETETLTELYRNEQYVKFLFNKDLHIVAKTRLNGDGSQTTVDKADRILLHRCVEDAFHTHCLRYNDAENAIYLLDNLRFNTTQLIHRCLNSSTDTVFGHDPRSDIEDVIFQFDRPVVYATCYTHKEWHVMDKSWQPDIYYLEKHLGSEFEITNQSKDGSICVVTNSTPTRGVSFSLYQRSPQTLQLLYTYPARSGLADMRALVIPASDGLQMVSYLSLPPESNNKPLPMVVVPHGGPFMCRDRYNYDIYHQWLASRGYAVLGVNFRLSSGFGREHLNLGNGQWGMRAHQDIVEAVQWCIDQKITEKGKVAMLGFSYGGYEALAALTFTPEVFAGAVAICGPSDLGTVLNKVSGYWELSKPVFPWTERINCFSREAFVKNMGGDPNNPSDVPHLASCSPLNYVDRITKPLLLVHGVNDPIVASSESDQIYHKMKAQGQTVTYLSFTDEGHGIEKFANQKCFMGFAEEFLSQILGGSCEPLSPSDLEAASVNIQSCFHACVE